MRVDQRGDEDDGGLIRLRCTAEVKQACGAALRARRCTLMTLEAWRLGIKPQPTQRIPSQIGIIFTFAP